jgi:hypothetical protein
MRFGFGRGGSAAAEAADEGASDAPYELASIELLTETGPVTGWIATEGERTSDWLNERDTVSVFGLEPGSHAPDVPSNEVTDVPRASIVWAVPPPLPANRHLRLHRRRVLVNLELDGWTVSGQVHIRPGAEATDQVLRGTRDMVPLTEVHVAPEGAPGQGASMPVLIVNRQHVRRIAEDHPSAEPDPVALRLEALGVPVPADAEETSPAPPVPDGVDEALQTLLEHGIIDATEVQVLRARTPRPTEG